jgi:uncharacterized protein (TIGR00369 family)
VPDLPFDVRDLGDGWQSWDLIDETRYNTAVLGKLAMRREGDALRLRMMPERRHTNLADHVHGGTTMGLIDIALFATMHALGSGKAGPSVTLELSTQFVGAGDPALPLDAVSEIVRETGRLAFVRGQVVQGDNVVAGYSGIIRKMNGTGARK